MEKTELPFFIKARTFFCLLSKPGGTSSLDQQQNLVEPSQFMVALPY
mgnify:CR=1 FL=1